MPASLFTFAFLLAFLATAGALQWWQEPTYPLEIWAILSSGALFGFLAIILGRLGNSMRRGAGVLVLCIIAGTSLALVRIAHTTHIVTEQSVEAYAFESCRGRKCPEVTLHGFITDAPDRRPMQTKYTVEVDRVILQRAQDDTGDSIPVSGKVLVTDHASYPRHEYGDEVLVRGTLERPGVIADADDPAAAPFHYDRYLRLSGITAIVSRARGLETLSAGHGNPLFAMLFRAKERFERQINRVFPEPHASFAAGLLTGSRRGMPEHVLRDFQATGLTHILAISGYNVALVIALISGALFFLPLRFRFAPSIAAIILFTLFVGASASVVRAAIMGCLSLLALHAGRQTHALLSILLAAAAMTLWNPLMLWYDLGFQLSLLAVLGLTLLAPLLTALTAWLPATLGIRESLTISLAAEIAVAPVILLTFGSLPLIAPLANLLVAPLIPLAMLCGFLGVAVSFLALPLGLFVAYPAWGALELILRITHLLAGFPAITGQSGAPWPWLIGWSSLVLLLFLLTRLTTTYTRTRAAPASPHDGRAATTRGAGAPRTSAPGISRETRVKLSACPVAALP